MREAILSVNTRPTCKKNSNQSESVPMNVVCSITDTRETVWVRSIRFEKYRVQIGSPIFLGQDLFVYPKACSCSYTPENIYTSKPWKLYWGSTFFDFSVNKLNMNWFVHLNCRWLWLMVKYLNYKLTEPYSGHVITPNSSLFHGAYPTLSVRVGHKYVHCTRISRYVNRAGDTPVSAY